MELASGAGSGGISGLASFVDVDFIESADGYFDLAHEADSAWGSGVHKFTIDVTEIGLSQRDESAARVTKHLRSLSSRANIVVAFVADIGDISNGWTNGGVIGAVWEFGETSAGLAAGAAGTWSGAKFGCRWGPKGCIVGGLLGGIIASFGTEMVIDSVFSQPWEQ